MGPRMQLMVQRGCMRPRPCSACASRMRNQRGARRLTMSARSAGVHLTLEPRVGELATVLGDRDSGNSPRETSIVAVTQTMLTLAAKSPVCQGSSGAPVFLNRNPEYPLVGVVSSGGAECDREVRVARISSAWRGFIENILAGREPTEVPRTCGECIEQSWDGNAPCVTSISACRHDKDCSDTLACLGSSIHRECLGSRSASQIDSDLFVRVRRCICLAACKLEYAESCRDM